MIVTVVNDLLFVIMLLLLLLVVCVVGIDIMMLLFVFILLMMLVCDRYVAKGVDVVVCVVDVVMSLLSY